MRTSLLAGMTTRGTSFLAAGIAAAFVGYLLGERGLLCVGYALIALPLLAAAAARRSQYRLATSRIISPPRVPAGHTANVTLRLENVSRVSTGLLLAEDAVPYALGTRPRYVLDKIERNGTRELTYSLRSDLRGRFEIGPLQLRVADSFGLVEVTRSLSGRTTFIVTPRVVPLARTVISRSWAGEGEGRARLAAMAGEDDVIPREYRDGDELRRVHWKSTARYGELMVRREEQRWRNRATVLLDSRTISHLGAGAGSSFETAISAAASVGVHVAQEGLTGQFISDADVLRSGPFFEDRLLDALAIIRPSAQRTMDRAFKELKLSGAGVIIAVMGKMSTAEAQQLAACRTAGSQGIVLLLDVATWADESRRGGVNGAAAATRPVPASTQPASARPASTQPESPAPDSIRSDGIAVAGIASDGAGRDRAPSDGAALKGTSPGGTLLGGTPSNGTPPNGTPPNGTPPNGARADGARADGTSSDDAAVAEPDRPDTVVLTSSGVVETASPAAPPRSVSARYSAESAAAAAILRGAGWHVASLDASTPVAVAWQRLPRAAEMLVATGTSIHPAAESGQPA
jgi:uncharacterized protein (DUF58 family)